MEIKKDKRLDYLDSARGFAAIFVVWGYFIFRYGMQSRIPLMTITLVIVLSAILYYLVEKPFIAYGKIVAAKISKKSS